MPFFHVALADKRVAEAARIRERYPDRIPVIVEKAEKSSVPDIDKKKYLVPGDLTVGQFVYVIRRRIKLSPEKAIFVFVKNVLPPTGESSNQRNLRTSELFFSPIRTVVAQFFSIFLSNPFVALMSACAVLREYTPLRICIKSSVSDRHPLPPRQPLSWPPSMTT